MAISSLIYDRFTDFGRTFDSFRAAVDLKPDLRRKLHREVLLKWLNQWQCRQFSTECHPLASDEILKWYKEFDEKRLPVTTDLMRMSDKTVRYAAAEYGKLARRTASERTRRGKKLTITIGPTGASKILFAIRPRSMVAWDEAMRKGLKYDGSPESYFDFLIRVRDDLLDIGEACSRKGFPIRLLPEKLDRPNATPPQLVGEYYYMTETRGLTEDDFTRTRRFANWG